MIKVGRKEVGETGDFFFLLEGKERAENEDNLVDSKGEEWIGSLYLRKKTRKQEDHENKEKTTLIVGLYNRKRRTER